jgi:hypothetical protein
MDLELADKVAVVTGASKRIGLAVARELAAEGRVGGRRSSRHRLARGHRARDPFAVPALGHTTPMNRTSSEACHPARYRFSFGSQPRTVGAPTDSHSQGRHSASPARFVFRWRATNTCAEAQQGDPRRSPAGRRQAIPWLPRLRIVTGVPGGVEGRGPVSVLKCVLRGGQRRRRGVYGKSRRPRRVA